MTIRHLYGPVGDMTVGLLLRELIGLSHVYKTLILELLVTFINGNLKKLVLLFLLGFMPLDIKLGFILMRLDFVYWVLGL